MPPQRRVRVRLVPAAYIAALLLLIAVAWVVVTRSSSTSSSSGGTSTTSGTGARPAGPATAADCAASGMCSLGTSREYVGELASNEGLRAALQAVAYKQEVVVVAGGSGA